ncbi:DUF3857 domain-containing protein [bacterium]|nr:DUF3857 domain-containing protein [bacterium]
MIKRIALSILILAAASSALRAQDTTDAVYENIQHEYLLRPDGSTLYSYSSKLKLLTPFAFTREYGESFITYNPKWQTLDVTRSETTMRDGSVVPSPVNAYNEVLPRSAAHAVPFNHLREMVVTHTGLEAGAVVDFAYTLESKPGMYPGLMGRVVCGSRNHVVQMSIRVVVPEGTELQWGFARDDIQPVITTEAGNTVYTWTRKHIPQYETEAHQSAPQRVLPVLYFSTSNYDAIALHVFGPEGPRPLPPHVLELGEMINRQHATPLASALALRDWVAKRVGRCSVPLDLIGYRARPVEEILEFNVGSDLDRAVMLAQLCRSIGLEASPVLFSHDVTTRGMRIVQMPGEQGPVITEIGPEATPNVPALQLFTHAGVICQGLGEYPLIVLDPSLDTQGGPCPSQYTTGYFMPIEGLPPQIWHYAIGPSYSTSSMTSDWSLGGDGYVSGRSSISVNGVHSAVFDSSGFQKSARASLVNAAQGLHAEAGPMTVQQGTTSVCEVSVDAKDPLKGIGGYFRFQIPLPPEGISALHLPIGDYNRITPVSLPGRMKEETRLVLHLEGYHAVDVPSPVEFQNNIGSIRSVIKADAHDVEVTRVLTIDVDEVKPEGYVDLQALLRAWRNPSHNTLLFKQN